MSAGIYAINYGPLELTTNSVAISNNIEKIAQDMEGNISTSMPDNIEETVINSEDSMKEFASKNSNAKQGPPFIYSDNMTLEEYEEMVSAEQD